MFFSSCGAPEALGQPETLIDGVLPIRMHGAPLVEDPVEVILLLQGVVLLWSLLESSNGVTGMTIAGVPVIATI